jgi:uncharacterized repeat protein (TIGR01451 family)
MFLVSSSAFAATKQWLNTSNDGLWTTASNWSPAGVPGPADDVQIGTSQTAFNCTLNASTTVNSVTITDPYITSPQLIITGGAQLTINAASSTASGTTIDMNGQILGAGSLSVGGPFVFRGGIIGGTGALTIASSGSLTFSGTGSSMQLNRATTNDGTITHSSATSSVYLGNVLTNTGLFHITVNADVYNSGSGSIENDATGTIRKSTGAGTAGFHVNVDNNAGGTIEAISGTLVLRGGTSASGSAFTTTNTPSQSTLQFGSGTTYTIVSGTSFGGSGIVQILGTLNVSAPADVTIANIVLESNGTISGSGVVRVGSAMTWNGGTMNGGGTTVVGLSSSLTLAGTNNYLYLDNRNLEIGGTANYTATSYAFYLYNGAVLNVVSGGTFNIQTDLDIQPGGTASSIVNAGTFQKITGSSDTTINIPISSSGAFNVLAGTVGLYNATLFNGGSISIGTTSFLDVRNSTTTFAAATAIGGTGGFRLDGGDVKVNSAVTQTLPRVTLQSTSSALLGPGSIILSGNPTFSSGSIGSSSDPGGTVEVPAGSTMTLTAGSGYKYFDSIAFTNHGTVNAQDPTYGMYVVNGASFTNAGTFDASVDGSLHKSGTSPTVTNNGLWKKSAGAGSYAIYAPFYTTGTIDLQSGNFVFAGTGTLNGTILSSAGTNLLVNTVFIVAPTVDFDGVNGTVEVPTSGQLTIASGNVTIQNLKLSGGTVAGAGTLTLTGSPLWTAGSMGEFAAQGGTTIVDAAATLTLSGMSYMYLHYNRVLQNLGTIVYTAPTYYLYLQSGGTLDNQGTFTYATDTGIFGSGAVSIDNSGTITKSTGSSTAAIDVVLHNSGTVVSQSGTLKLGGTSATNTHAGGTFTATAPGSFVFGGGTHTLDAASSLGGTGIIGANGGANVTVDAPFSPAGFTINNATLTLNTSGSVASLEMLSSAILGGTGTLTVTSSGTWSGGTMQGSGTTIIASGATLNITGATGYAYLNTRTLTNNGTIAYSAPSSYLNFSNAATLNNTGAFHITTDAQIYSSHVSDTINNSGTMTKSAGSGVMPIAAVLNNSGNITVTSGTMQLNKGGTHTGPFTATTPGAIAFGGGTHTVGATSTLGGTGTIAVSGGTVDVAGTFNPATLNITNGTLNLNSNGTVAMYTQQLGTLGGTGTLTITGAGTWSGGTMSGSGATVINSGVTFSMTASYSYTYLDARTITNNGTFANNGSPYYLNLSNGATINNTAAMTLNDSNIYSSHAADSIVNTGTLTKSSGSGTATLYPALNSHGTLTVSAGRLTLAGGGTSSGPFTINSPGQLELASGTRSINGPGAVTATGPVFVTGGTTTISDAWSFASLKITNGILNLNANGSIGALDLQGGTLNGLGVVTVTTSASWSGGTMSGPGTTIFNSGVTAAFSGSNSYMLIDTRTVTNNGTINYAAAPYYLYFQNGGTLNNAGTFLIGNDQYIYSYSLADTINNSGTWSKIAGTGDTEVYPAFVNSGSVNVTAGEMTLRRGGTQSGPFNVTSPGILDFAGTNSITAASSLSGSGTYRFSSGTTDVNGPYASKIEVTGGTVNLNVNGTIPTLTMTAGTLGGNAVVTVANTLTWNGGSMDGSGTTIIPAAATATIANTAGYAYLTNRTLENDGTVIYGAGPYYLNVSNGQILNDGTFNLTGDGTLYATGSGAMTNNGTLQKTGGSGTLNYYLPTTNSGTFRAAVGTLYLLGSYTQTAGTTDVSSGATLKNSSALAINGGSLTGSGTIDGSVINSAIVAPGTSPGALTVTGSYTQTAAGALNIELGGTTPGTQYDQLNVTGAVTLDGTLNVSAINSFVPATGDVFQILGFGSRSGDFAVKNGLSLGGGTNLIATYGANNLQLSTNTIAADVFVSQTISPSPSVSTGQNFTYNVTVTNGGASSASNVTLSGTLPANVTLVSKTPSQGSCSGNPTITCNLGALANGASATIAIVVTAGGTGSAPFTVNVTASEFDPDSTDNSATATATIGPKADLSVTLTDSPDPVNGNGTITYAINVANAGPSAATSLTLNFSVNSGATINTIGAAGWSCSGGATSRSCTMASMGSGGSSNITVTATAPNSTATITANALVGSTVFDANSANNSASTTTATNVCAPPAISAPSNVEPNSAGNQASTPLLDATYAWTITGGTITAGQNTNLVTFTAGASGEVTLTVEVTAAACTQSSTVTIAIEQPEADVSIAKSGPTTVAPGATFTYTLSVTNSGPATAYDIVVIDTLPAGLTYVSNSANGWNCTHGGDTLSCTSTTLFAGSTRSINLTVKAPDAPATITNTVTVSTSTQDSDSSNNDGSATTTVESTAPVCPASAPALNLPSDGAANVASPVTFSWNAVTNATSYELFIASGNASPSLAGTTIGTSLTVPMAGGPATWYVVARAAGCDGVASVTRSLTVALATNCNLNPAPQLIAPASGATVNSPVTFQWSAVNGALGYTLWVALGSEPPQDFGATTNTTLTTNVPAGAVQWFIEAHFAGCPSTASARASFTVPQPAPCQNEIPRLVAPANNTSSNTATIAFSWTPVTNADGYRVWIQLDGQPAQVVGETTDTTLIETIPAGSMTWWVEALFEGCASRTTEKFKLTVPRAQQCNTSVAELIAPSAGFNTSTASVTFSWSAVPRAVKYEVWLSLNSGTPSLLATTTSTTITREVAEGELTWFVRTIFDGCDPTDSLSATFRYAAAAACANNERPVLLTPSEGEQLPSPVDFRWQNVGAASYELWIAKGNGNATKVRTSTTNEANEVELPNGAHRWFVRAIFGSGCPDADSAESRVVIIPQAAACSALDAPVIAAPGQISHHSRGFVQWSFVPGATAYVLQMSSHPEFSSSDTETLNMGEQRSYPFVFDNTGSAPMARYARVRAVDERCQPASIGAYSERAVIYVLPSITNDVSTLAGATNEVTYTLPLGGELAGLRFSATPTQPWLSVTPANGVVPPGGINLTVVARTSGLPAGTSIGGVTINTTDATNNGVRASASSSSTTPVSISIVSPVSPTPKNTPPPDALLIPAVAHANGVNSQFQSDVRVSNTSPQVMKYQLTFTPSGESGIAKGQQTNFTVEPGQTIALDDILKTWFGSGTSQLVGSLEVRALTTSSKSTASAVAGLPNLLTFASSRTYNVTAKGTFGQYVPAIPFSSFIDAGSKSVLQLPQIAQSAQYRTNLGFVEGSGQPATLLVTVYGQSGKLTEFPVSLTGGQHLQLNSVLASKGIDSLDDGRIEVRVTAGSGKVTAYASVLDAQTNDPLLVAPINVASEGAQKWVVPGVADLHQGFAEWRSDMRLFNAGTEAVDATLTFYSQSGGEPKVRTMTINAGEVKQLDSTLNSVFGVSNDGGAVHVSTPKASKLIATARTYNQTTSGTYGQFIAAVTPNEAAAKGTRPLQILQVEESERYRSNIGLAEVSGKPVRIEVAIVRPESKNAAILEMDLEPNEFRQLNRLLESAGLAGTYNARVTVRVLSGDGRVTAYASVVDMETQDPTYIPAQ